ncbi:MAG: glycosyltransferase family 39 protein [Candidatus Woesearchaeota archaeon]|nr:glycosyltransferase family 39 protein [Candidatus Woesearchaeota archaeon]
MNKNKDYLIYAVLIVLSVIGSLIYFNQPLADSDHYFDTTRFMQGKDAVIDSPWASRMLVPLIAAALEPIFGMSITYSLLSILFYCLSSILAYVFFKDFFKNKHIGFISAIIFATSLPLIAWGGRPLIETAGFFFLFLGIAVIEWCLKKGRVIDYAVIGIVMALAILAKDHNYILPVYFILSILFKDGFSFVKKANNENRTNPQIKVWDFCRAIFGIENCRTKVRGIKPTIFNKILKILAAFFISILPAYLWRKLLSLHIASKYPNYINFFLQYQFNFSTILWMFGFRTFITFHILWIPFVFGLFSDKDKERRGFYLKNFVIEFTAIIFIFVVVGLFSPRYAFMLFPFVIPLAAYGLYDGSRKLAKKLKLKNFYLIIVAFLIIYALLSYFGASLYPEDASILKEDLLQMVFKRFNQVYGWLF